MPKFQDSTAEKQDSGVAQSHVGLVATADNTPGSLDHRKEQVIGQLRRILSSRGFRRSLQLQKLLEFLVLETLAGRGEELNQYIIGTKLFRIAGYDPESSTLVRAHARRLRTALSKYYFNEGNTDSPLITLVPGNYTPRFEFRDATLPTNTPSAVDVGNRALPALAIFEVQGLNMTGAWENLPCLLAEELCIQLSTEKSLRILGPLPLPESLGKKPNCLPLARQYGADLILEGGVERSRGKVILRLLLRETEKSEILWNQRVVFDETERFLPVESMITRSLFEEIMQDYGIISTHLCNNASRKDPRCLNIHEAMLLSRAFLRTFSESAYRQGIDALVRTLSEYPYCASLHAAKAWLIFGGYCEPFTRAEGYPKELRAAAETAFRLDPGDPWGQAAMCMDPLLTKDYATLSRRGLRLASAQKFPPLVGGIVGCLLIYGRVNRNCALQLIKAAMEQNPYHPRFLNFPLALNSLLNQRWKRMEYYADGYHIPEDWGYRLVKLLAVLGKGRQAEASIHWQALLEIFPRFDRVGIDHLRRFLHEDYVMAISDLLHSAIFRQCLA